jgi:cob(I)alamin adenosyltransferase
MVKRKGYVHIYTGDGKGKTTAALGLALRAAGHGWHTYIGQFMKGQAYGELHALQDHPAITISPAITITPAITIAPAITIEQFSDDQCLLHKTDVTETHIKQAQEGLQRCWQEMQSGRFQLMVLDEVLVAIWFGLVSEEQILEFLRKRSEDVEVVLTGRYAPERLIDRADLVTDMRCVKHYYEHGITARDGIER